MTRPHVPVRRTELPNMARRQAEQAEVIRCAIGGPPGGYHRRMADPPDGRDRRIRWGQELTSTLHAARSATIDINGQHVTLDPELIPAARALLQRLQEGHSAQWHESGQARRNRHRPRARL